MRFCADVLTRRRRGQRGPTMRRTTMRQIAMRQITMRQGLTIAAALTLVPTAAFAHPGIGEMHGFTHGFAHPLGGLDHMLAMVTVGIFAWQLGGRALWLGPAAFGAAVAARGAAGPTRGAGPAG